LVALAELGLARHASRRYRLALLVAEHGLAHAGLLPALGVHPELANVHLVDRRLAIGNLVSARFRDDGVALRLDLGGLLFYGRALRLALVLHHLRVAGADLAAGHGHLHLALFRLHRHRALVLGAGIVV